MYVVLVIITTYIASQLVTFINFDVSLIILAFVSILLFFVNNKFSIKQEKVIETIMNDIQHSIGYYSIALTFLFNFKNILTPVWTVIVYSHETPPKFKTITEVNAFSGTVLGDPYTESINA